MKTTTTFVASRRGILGMGLAALAIPAASSVLSACGGGSSGGAGPSGSAVKNLVVAATRGAVALDPDTGAGAPATQVWLNIYDTLVDTSVPADGTPAAADANAGLAASWTTDESGLVWTFALQPSCESAAGNELTADDILWSVERSLAMQGSPGFFYMLAGITDVAQLAKVDDKTVSITLAEAPQPYFVQLLGAPWMAIYDSVEMKKHATDADPWAAEWLTTNAAGFGPFSLADRSSDGSRATLTANPKHWKAPALETITWTVAEPANSLQLLTRGESMLGNDYSPSQLDQVAGTDGVQVVEIASAGTTFLGMQNTIAPFTDKALRQGIAKALPFSDIVASAYGSYAEQWTSHIVPSFDGFTDTHWAYGDNAVEAPELADYQGTTVTLSYLAGSPSHEAIAVLVQSSLADAGLDAQLSALDQTTFDTERLAGKLPFYIDDTDVPAVPNAAYQLSHLFATQPIQQLFGYQNPEIDELIAGLKTATGDERAQLLDRAQEILAEDVPTIPLAWTKFHVPAGDQVTGFQGHVMNLLWVKELSL